MQPSSLRASLLAGLLLPASAFALSFTDSASDYSDAPFSRSETAAISLLTEVGAVEGNPDGSFRPERGLNRAEFLKIVLLAKGDTGLNISDSADCFPDVRSSSWYSPYVCFAEDEGIIDGYPDGYFRPEKAVNFAEAVKIIVEVYDLELPVAKANERWAWYRPYILAAGDRGLLFNENMDPAALLTRGQMARIAARFVADDAGELDTYLDTEKGTWPSSSSSSSRSSSSSSVSSSSSSMSSSSSSMSSSSSSSSSFISGSFPARSQFLILGERSKAIASATFFADLEPVLVRGVEVELEQEVESIDSMFLVDSAGVQLAQLSLDKFDGSDKRWTASFAATYRIPKGEQRVLGIEVRMKPRNGGGSSDRTLQVDTFRIDVEGEWSANTYLSAAPTFSFPLNQTAQGRITSAVNALAETTASIPVGVNQLVAAFTIAGTHVSGTELRVEHLEFSVSKSVNVNITNWQLGIPESNERINCSVSSSIVTCSNIPVSMGTITSGPRTLRLFGDVTLSADPGSPFLQVSLNQPGNTGEFGAIRWNDGTASFNWTELDTPVARSTRFQ